MTRFIYEIVLRVEDEEDNPDMPSLLINRIGDTIATEWAERLSRPVTCTKSTLTRMEN